MAPPLSIPLLLLTILVFSSTLFSSSEARNGIKISSLISQDLYNSIFLHKDDSACPAKDFYPYSAFIEATERFPRFGSCGSLATRKREIAAFLAQISHETTGGWATAPDGPYAWGLCFKEEKPKPSCHDVMIGRYKPTAADIAANRTAGFGLVTNIINGGLECGIGSDSRVNDRIGFFQRYAKLFNVDTGSNLDCASQKSF
uniref:Glycoside hydrolase family 19 catalytic domain-containing protein n=1 Tax=Daucus carota subsp. sativus TaxID=79200 RepID=A0A162B5J9_DAUCS